tara:strand:- start:97 stop:276 length:180 start_codon:yes stop_codon:yes gene_type:complete
MKRERNPYAGFWTFEDFKVKYFGENQDVPKKIAREFWNDFNYAFVGGLNRYIEETTEIC